MVEMENKATAKTYDRVVYKYMSKLMEVSGPHHTLTNLTDESNVLGRRMVLRGEMF